MRLVARPLVAGTLALCSVLWAAGPARAQQQPSALEELFAPADLIRSLGEIATGKDTTGLAILATGLGLSMASLDEADEWAFRAIGPRSLGTGSDVLSVAGSRLVLYPALIGGFFVSQALEKPGIAATSARAVRALLITDLIVAPTKLVVARQRPDGSNRRSFPSGHAAGSFAVAVAMSHRTGAAVKIPVFALAAAISVSRIDKRRHFLSDVLAGAAIGLVAGRAVNRRAGVTRVQVHPVIGSHGGSGVGFTLLY